MHASKACLALVTMSSIGLASKHNEHDDFEFTCEDTLASKAIDVASGKVNVSVGTSGITLLVEHPAPASVRDFERKLGIRVRGKILKLSFVAAARDCEFKDATSTYTTLSQNVGSGMSPLFLFRCTRGVGSIQDAAGWHPLRVPPAGISFSLQPTNQPRLPDVQEFLFESRIEGFGYAAIPFSKTACRKSTWTTEENGANATRP